MAKLNKAPKIDLSDLIESTALSVQRALSKHVEGDGLMVL
jgi:hypothetical protein